MEKYPHISEVTPTDLIASCKDSAKKDLGTVRVDTREIGIDYAVLRTDRVMSNVYLTSLIRRRDIRLAGVEWYSLIVTDKNGYVGTLYTRDFILDKLYHDIVERVQEEVGLHWVIPKRRIYLQHRYRNIGFESDFMASLYKVLHGETDYVKETVEISTHYYFESIERDVLSLQKTWTASGLFQFMKTLFTLMNQNLLYYLLKYLQGDKGGFEYFYTNCFKKYQKPRDIVKGYRMLLEEVVSNTGRQEWASYVTAFGHEYLDLKRSAVKELIEYREKKFINMCHASIDESTWRWQSDLSTFYPKDLNIGDLIFFDNLDIAYVFSANSLVFSECGTILPIHKFDILCVVPHEEIKDLCIEYPNMFALAFLLSRQYRKGELVEYRRKLNV